MDMIHQYKNNGYNIVLDVNSGSVHVVDDAAYDIIALYEDHPRDEIVRTILNRYDTITEEEIYEVFEDLDQLKKDGKLFSEDTYENLAFDFKKDVYKRQV